MFVDSVQDGDNTSEDRPPTEGGSDEQGKPHQNKCVFICQCTVFRLTDFFQYL